MPTFKGTTGKVQYKTAKMQGCCGVGIIYHVTFTTKAFAYICSPRFQWNEEDKYVSKSKKELKTLYKEFHEFLKSSKDVDDVNRSRLLMSDNNNLYDTCEGSIYGFCKKNKWKSLGIHLNGRSGNWMEVFELKREYIKQLWEI